MKGIILAGGSGTRLFPSTIAITKQLIPIYDKPMIYYPLSILMISEITEILIISTPCDIEKYKKLFGNGNQIGLNISYKIQYKADGLASAFTLGEEFINNDNVCLILGDNVFYGNNLENILLSCKQEIELNDGSIIFGYRVDDPHRYGIVEFNKNFKVVSIEEKPKYPKSNYAIPGLYFYDKNVVEFAKTLKPSERGEYEITDLNKVYLERNQLTVKPLNRGFAWLDAGTNRSLLESSQFIQTIQDRQGVMIACLEEIAFNKNYISLAELIINYKKMKNSDYGKYILKIIEEYIGEKYLEK
jgi:glucose-1-phosphate thymidylyltransferase